MCVCAINAIFVSSIVLTMKLLNLYLNSTALFLVRYFYILKWHFWDLSIDMGIFWGSWFLHIHEIPHPNQWGSMKNHTKNDVNSSKRSDILVFNCYLCHVSFFAYLLCLQHQDRWNFWHIQVFWELCFSDTWSSHKNLCCGIKVYIIN